MSRIVVKIGTNALTRSHGELDREVISNLVQQIVSIKKQKIDVILVTSGAVGSGRKFYTDTDCVKKRDLLSKNKVTQRQVFASIGQIKLMEMYFEYFLGHNFFCSQVLVTKEDFRDRKHFLNMRNCIEALLDNHIVPIVNENDVVSVSELMFSDNDELACLIGAMIGADKIIILSDVEGLYDRAPGEEGAQVINQLKVGDDWKQYVVAKKSTLGRGGMESKCRMAEKLARIGIETVLAHGKRKGVLKSVVAGESVGTRFLPEKRVSAFKKWLAISAEEHEGSITVNKGAEEAIIKGASLLPIGAVSIEGEFKRGETLEIKNEEGLVFAVGMAHVSAEEAHNTLGKANQKPLVHRDSIFLE